MPFAYFLLVLISLGIYRPLSVFLHELGHGIPALWLTKDKVTLYIGSYGDVDNSWHIKLGRLECFFHKKILEWQTGLCVTHSKEVTHNQSIMITIGGPLVSLALVLIFGYLCYIMRDESYRATVFFFFVLSSLFDLYSDAIPNKTPIMLHEGTLTYNDGQQLKRLFSSKKYISRYREYAELYNNNQFEKCAPFFKQLIEDGFKNAIVYRVAISAYLQIKDYKTASLLQTDFESQYEETIFNVNDYCNAALIKCRLEDYEAGLKDYTHALKLDPDNLIALNNRGYTYNILEQYNKALIDFDRALSVDPDYAYTFNNRGLAKIKLGDLQGGLADINKSMELDSKNSYAYRNLGIYHLHLNENERALSYFEKALALDDDTHQIQELIVQASLKKT